MMVCRDQVSQGFVWSKRHKNLQGASVTVQKHISFPHCFLYLQLLSLVKATTPEQHSLDLDIWSKVQTCTGPQHPHLDSPRGLEVLRWQIWRRPVPRLAYGWPVGHCTCNPILNSNFPLVTKFLKASKLVHVCKYLFTWLYVLHHQEFAKLPVHQAN